MGQSAFNAPSSAAVTRYKGLKCQIIRASIAVIVTVIRHALYPGIFRTLSATISQIIGASARIKCTNCMSYSLLPLKREAAHSLLHRFSLFSYLIGYQKNVISYTINEITFHSCRQTHRKPCLLTLKSRLYWSTNFVLLVLPLYENFKLFGDYCQYNSRYLRAFPCFYQFSQTCFVKIAHPSPELPDRMLQITPGDIPSETRNTQKNKR